MAFVRDPPLRRIVNFISTPEAFGFRSYGQLPELVFFLVLEQHSCVDVFQLCGNTSLSLSGSALSAQSSPYGTKVCRSAVCQCLGFSETEMSKPLVGWPFPTFSLLDLYSGTSKLFYIFHPERITRGNEPYDSLPHSGS